MDKTLYTRSDFDECTVIGHHNDFAFYLVAYFQVGIESIPGMRLQLFQAQSDTFLLVVEVEDNDVEFLVERNHLFGVRNTAPREVGDVNQTVYAAQVDEYTIRGNVLDGTLENLTFFEFGDDLFLLLLELGLDESLVRNNHVLEFLIDFNHLEFHRFSYEYIVVADGFHVDLRTGQECFDAKYIDNHTALGTTFDITLDDFVVFESRVNTIPRTGSAGFLVRQNQLSFLVFLIFDINLYFVSHFQIGIVAEFAHRNDTIRFVTDVYDYLALVQGDNRTFDYLFVFNGVQRLVISFYQFVVAFVAIHFAIFIGVPVEIFYRAIFQFFTHVV